MSTAYKEKAPKIQAVHFTDPLRQLGEVASMLSATGASYTAASATESASGLFLVGENSYRVSANQVVALINDEVTVTESGVFFDKYEPAN